jgi:predicted ATP-dependent endonuclease of OLD family
MYIQKVSVKNFRSLKDISIGNLSKAVILYGENDSGKSNILSFLEILFQQKYSVDEITTDENLKRPSGFWQGRIDNFSNNFYLNGLEPITYSVLVKFDRRELLGLANFPKNFISNLPHNHREDVLILEGKIVDAPDDSAEISLIRAELNQKMFFDSTKNKPEYLSDFNELTDTEKRNVFDTVMNRLDNAFLRIPADRFLSNEIEVDRETKVALSPKTIKNWLFQSSHDQDAEKIVREVIQQFNSDPFCHGNVSIVRVGKNEIEAFVEGENGMKLPISRRGTGVQQILMILAYIAQSNSPIVGIEELEINLSPKTQSLILNDLLKLIQLENSIVKQIFLTTHSPHIAKRNEAQRRGVWMEKGITKVKKPSEAEIGDFFKFI